jgi:hypothetical protein
MMCAKIMKQNNDKNENNKQNNDNEDDQIAVAKEQK